MNREKTGSFWSSVYARVIFVVVLVSIGVMVIIQIREVRMEKTRIEEYYRSIGKLAVNYAAEIAENYAEDLPAVSGTSDEEQLCILTNQKDIEDIYVEVSEPPYQKAHALYGYTQNHVMSDEEIGTRWGSEYELSEAGRTVFCGDTEYNVTNYQNDGKTMLSYMRGIYNSQGECTAVVGVDFQYDVISDTFAKTMSRTILIIGLLFLAMILVLVMMLRRMILNPVKDIGRQMSRLVEGDRIRAEKIPVRGSNEFTLIARAYNTMTDEIHAYVDTQSQLKAAAQIQAGLLPAPSCVQGGCALSAMMKPAREIGGDFYDYFRLEDGRTFFVIADVSGKGFSAAMFMAAASYAIRYNARLHKTPAEILAAANNDLADKNPEQLFVTAFAAVYEENTHTLTYCNAGHNPPYLTGGSLRKLDGAAGMLLGLFPDEAYENDTIRIHEGEILYLYTDGVTEAVNDDRKMFGTGRLEEVLRQGVPETDKNPAEKAEKLIEKIREKLAAFTRNAEQYDDVTMMAVCFRGNEEKEEIVLPALLSENRTLRNFILKDARIPESIRKKLCLAAEEVFVNICSYAYNAEGGSVRVLLSADESTVTLVFEDSGAAYNPLEAAADAKEYDPDLQIGGLGKRICFSVMDQVSYERRDGKNILMMKKTTDNQLCSVFCKAAGQYGRKNDNNKNRGKG